MGAVAPGTLVDLRGGATPVAIRLGFYDILYKTPYMIESEKR
jgi:hypothetical protein